MILIAHRGNISGPNPEQENSPEYIRAALDAGYDVEIDLWYKDNKLYLGHDTPQYEIDPLFIRKRGLWIHCKDYATLSYMSDYPANYFYHTDEDYVVTRYGWIWAYPGQPGVGEKTICVMPEWNNTPVVGYGGVCTDYVEKYREKADPI